MQTFELILDVRQTVKVQAENIEQAEKMLRQQLEANPKAVKGVWDIIVPKEV